MPPLSVFTSRTVLSPEATKTFCVVPTNSIEVTSLPSGCVVRR